MARFEFCRRQSVSIWNLAQTKLMEKNHCHGASECPITLIELQYQLPFPPHHNFHSQMRKWTVANSQHSNL
jgi:hypothetical protein